MNLRRAGFGFDGSMRWASVKENPDTTGATNTRKLVFRLTLPNKPKTIPIHRNSFTRIRHLHAWIAERKKSGQQHSKSGGMKSPKERFIPVRFGAVNAEGFCDTCETNEENNHSEAYPVRFVERFALAGQM
jgi:hypothetical protein